MAEIDPSRVKAGQAVYGKFTLQLYDALVLGASCRWLWKCSADRMLAQYNRLVTDNHLDVGVGSGYFLDHCHFPSPSPRVVLMDMNRQSLAFTARRIARYRPETCCRNVLEDMSVDSGKFDSIGMNLLLHCVPGDFAYKGVIFGNAKQVMRPGAVLFGATILQQGVHPNWGARRLMGIYNNKGIFSNTEDSAARLQAALEQHFPRVDVRVKGCIALFSATLQA